jgi:predicted transposase YbfD/YdcC
VLSQLDVDGQTNEITRFEPLLEELDLAACVITADGLHTQRETAAFVVTTKNAHYILIVKENQPCLYATIRNLPWKDIPPATAGRTKATAGRSAAT